MLETLAGRLKWEQTQDGIRVELPVQFAWSDVGSTVGYWLLLLAMIFFLDGLRGHTMHWRALLGFVPLYVGLGIWKLLERRTILTLTSDEMSVNQSYFQEKWNRRTYVTGRLHYLRYCESRTEPTAERRDVKNSLLCDVEYQTIGLFDGITEEEAVTLIAKMKEVYPFPKYPMTKSAVEVVAS